MNALVGIDSLLTDCAIIHQGSRVQLDLYPLLQLVRQNRTVPRFVSVAGPKRKRAKIFDADVDELIEWQNTLKDKKESTSHILQAVRGDTERGFAMAGVERLAHRILDGHLSHCDEPKKGDMEQKWRMNGDVVKHLPMILEAFFKTEILAARKLSQGRQLDQSHFAMLHSVRPSQVRDAAAEVLSWPTVQADTQLCSVLRMV